MNEPETTTMDAILEPVRNRLTASPTAPATPRQPASAERRQQEIGLVLDTIRQDIFTFQTNPGQDRTATERLLARISTGVEVIRGMLQPEPSGTEATSRTHRSDYPGATFQIEVIEVQTPEAVQDFWDQLLPELKHEFGHNDHNGTFSTCAGLEITSLTFPAYQAAHDWLRDNTKKWEKAKAVRIPECWVIGGWCAE